MATNPYGWITKTLTTIQRAGWQRSVTPLQGRPGAVTYRNGQPLVNFASNDYLGLAGDERVIQTAIAATQALGTGATGSRLLSGHRDLHRQLERAIAQWKQTEDAIVFSSGYLANLGTVSTLVGNRDLILADQYNHASLKSGTRLSGATVQIYSHNDMAALRGYLQERDRYRRCLILSDSVFSMDGDLCPLAEILDLAAQFDSMVLVDEAHATGVLGATGAGCVEHWGCTGRPLVQVGTLSKALGSLGGYVAGSAELIELLRNRASSWIYTTGLPPANTAAALRAIAIIQEEPERRARLWLNILRIKQALQEKIPSETATFPEGLMPSDSPILCLPVRDVQTVIHLGHQLQQAGILVSAVRPPTVPTSRLRLSIMATHTPEQGDRLIEALGTQL